MVPVTDVKINGGSILAEGVANIPHATSDTYGVTKLDGVFTLIDTIIVEETVTEVIFRFPEQYNGVALGVIFPSNISGTFYGGFGESSMIAGTGASISGKDAIRVTCFDYHGMWRVEGEGGASSGVADNYGAVSTYTVRLKGVGSGNFRYISYCKFYTFSSVGIPAGTKIRVYAYK